MVNSNGNDGKPSESFSSASRSALDDFLELIGGSSLVDLDAARLPHVSFQDILLPNGAAASLTSQMSQNDALIQILEEAERIVQRSDDLPGSESDQPPNDEKSMGRQ